MFKHLTKNEEIVMGIIWDSDKPLISMEILERCTNARWDHTYILHMLRALEKKGLVEVCGTVRSGKQYARQFIASVSKEEYVTDMVLKTGINGREMLWVASALISKADYDEKMVGRLREIIEELEND